MLHKNWSMAVFAAVGLTAVCVTSPALAGPPPVCPSQPGGDEYDLVPCSWVGGPADGSLCCASYCRFVENNCYSFCLAQYPGSDYPSELGRGYCDGACTVSYNECVNEAFSFRNFTPTGGASDNDLVLWTGGTPATPVSAVHGYWGFDNSQHVNYIDSAGHVHELYIHPGAWWVDNDLTLWTGAPPASQSGGLSGYWGSDNSQHVNFIDLNGHVHELYIHPGAGWVDNDLILWTGGTPAYTSSALDGYWGANDASQHVNYIDINGHVRELYIHPGAGWIDNDLVARTGGPPAAWGSGLDGYWGSDNSQHVNYIDGVGHVHELYIHPGANWVDNDLTVWMGAPLASSGGGLDGYWGSDSSQHVNFIDDSGSIHELYIHPGAFWVDNNLTAMAMGTPAALWSPLNGFWGSDSSQHVNFVDNDGDVHQLYIYQNGQWGDEDVTAALSAPAFTTGLGGYWGNDGSQHINYVDGQGHVQELYAP
jgi:hypothetical protein